jgi:hypothetical protein
MADNIDVLEVDGRSRNGRPKGSVGKIPKVVKEALLLAADDIGFPCDVWENKYDGEGSLCGRVLMSRTMTGKDGIRGYLQHLGLTDQKTFAGLLGRVIPQQINVMTESEHVVKLLTIDDVIEEMKAKGIPEAPRPRQRP